VGKGKAAARGEEKFRVCARLDKPRSGVIWLINGFPTIILTIAFLLRHQESSGIIPR
jgi:hypothetical protein